MITPQNNLLFGNLPIATTSTKGGSQKNPILPKYHYIWNVSSLFKLIQNMPVTEDYMFVDLTKKLTMLMILTTGG